MTRACLAVLLVLAACSQKADPPRPAGDRATASGPAASPPAAATSPAADPAKPPMSAPGACDVVITAAIREAHFSGGAVTQAPGAGENAFECLVATAGEAAARHTIRVTCHPRVVAQRADMIASLKSRIPTATELDIGAGGVVSEDKGKASVLAWDDDTDCSLTLSYAGTVDAATAAARDLIASLR
jgi:hypothetical protein